MISYWLKTGEGVFSPQSVNHKPLHTMNLTKIAQSTYSFKDAVISSVYNKEDKNFLYTVERNGYYTATSIQKSILTMSNEIEKVYNTMKEIESSVDIDWDLTDAELALANYIRSFNPEQDEVVPVNEIGETQDEVLIALNQYLTTESEEDYSSFRDALDWECAQDLAEELAIS